MITVRAVPETYFMERTRDAPAVRPPAASHNRLKAKLSIELVLLRAINRIRRQSRRRRALSHAT